MDIGNYINRLRFFVFCTFGSTLLFIFDLFLRLFDLFCLSKVFEYSATDHKHRLCKLLVYVYYSLAISEQVIVFMAHEQ